MTVTRRSRVNFPPEVLAEIRRRYEDTDEAQTSIADSYNIDRTTLARMAKAQGWKLRSDRAPYELPPAAAAEARAADAVAHSIDNAPGDGVDSTDAAAVGSIADRVEAALENELRRMESQRTARSKANQGVIDDQRATRTLAMLTEALFKARRLREPGSVNAADDDDLPADTHGFRINLALRIEAFVRSRADGSVSGGSEPADGEPAAS
jgi:hypothetical protein